MRHPVRWALVYVIALVGGIWSALAFGAVPVAQALIYSPVIVLTTAMGYRKRRTRPRPSRRNTILWVAGAAGFSAAFWYFLNSGLWTKVWLQALIVVPATVQAIAWFRDRHRTSPDGAAGLG